MFGGIVVNILLAVSPLKYAFGLDCLNWKHWLIAVGVALIVIPAGEVYKLAIRFISRKRAKKHSLVPKIA